MASASNTAGEGERIGNYRYVRTILAGQNSEIHEVVQDGTGKRFAIKELLESRAGDAGERRQLEAEAKLGMTLTHPNLIRIYEFVKDKHRPYFVMDLFPSEHLLLMLNKPERLEWLRPRLHRVLDQTASAIAYVHDKGWVHRDIKPENILVNRGGEVRVIDLALAKRVPTGLSKMFAGKPPREGTKSYMSPEQIRCLPPAITADVYSFGITCYELACGRPLFRANSAQELLNKHVREIPLAPTVHNAAITREYSDLVMQMIRKNPAERPPSLREFLSRFSKIRIYQDDPDPQVAAFG